MRHTARPNDLMPLAALYAVSLIPGAQAYCYFDSLGREHCTLSTGVRIGIAIAGVVGSLAVLIALRTIQRRRTRQANMTYVNTSAIAGAVPPPGYAPQGVPPGFPPQGGPPGFAPQGGPPGFQPQGPPPGSPPQGGYQPDGYYTYPQGGYQPEGYYPYPQGGPAQYPNGPNPSQTPPQYPPQSYDGQAPYAPPPGPPPGWSSHPDYAPASGPPPTSNQNRAV